LRSGDWQPLHLLTGIHIGCRKTLASTRRHAQAQAHLRRGHSTCAPLSKAGAHYVVV
jgi:hypothetical protein